MSVTLLRDGAVLPMVADGRVLSVDVARVMAEGQAAAEELFARRANIRSAP